jgi:hypothetical protein
MMMDIARLGQRDFMAGGDRRVAGLHNAVTSGRSVTFTLQNLSGKVDGFDAWYEGVQATLKADPVCRWFVELRNRIEKQGTVGDVTRGVQIDNLILQDLRRDAPPGARDVFFGDQYGRAGWVCQSPDGAEHTVYFTLPDSVGRVWMEIDDAPKDGRALQEHMEHWLSMLQRIVDEAMRKFGGASC